MKTFLLVFLFLCFPVGIVTVAQSPPNQALQRHQAAGIQSTFIIMGTVSEQGEKLGYSGFLVGTADLPRTREIEPFLPAEFSQSGPRRQGFASPQKRALDRSGPL
jgi:hypothetical protein